MSAQLSPLSFARLATWCKCNHLLPWLMCAASLALTYELQDGAQQVAMQALQKEFEIRAVEAVDHIEKRMLEYSQTLRGLDGVIAHDGKAGRGEFHAYVTAMQLDKYYPGVQAVGFTLIVPPDQQSRHIATLRKQGFPDYTIHPAGQRDLYTANIYIEPFSGRNLRAFGYDPYSDPVRRSAMERARDLGEVAITGKVKLVQEETGKDAQARFLMYQPVYRAGAPHNSVAERRVSIIGWVFASFPMDDLMAGIHGMRSHEIGVEIYDGETRSDATLMHDPNARHDNSLGSSMLGPLFEVVRRIEIAGHPWMLEIYSQPGLDATLDKSRARLITKVGIGISLLLTLITWLLVSNKERILRGLLDEQKRITSALESQKFALDQHAIVSITDVRGDITYANDKFCEISGYIREELLGNNHRMVKSGLHPDDYYLEMWRTIAAGRVWQEEFCNQRKDGRHYWLHTTIVPYFNKDGKPWQYVAISTDITAIKTAQEHMRHMAHFDTLTDLPNRALFSDRLHQALAATNRNKAHLAVIFFDLDKFKPINDTLGHAVGDLLLMEVAKRLQDCVRASDTAARIGGDEFVVLLSTIEAEQDALAVAEKIRHALEQPFELAGHRLHISSSLGVAIYPEHGNDEKTLLKNADLAMYYAKRAGRNIVMLYRPEMQET